MLDEVNRCLGNRPHPVFTTGERPPNFFNRLRACCRAFNET
jgi:hypothetical protein